MYGVVAGSDWLVLQLFLVAASIWQLSSLFRALNPEPFRVPLALFIKELDESTVDKCIVLRRTVFFRVQGNGHIGEFGVDF